MFPAGRRCLAFRFVKSYPHRNLDDTCQYQDVVTVLSTEHFTMAVGFVSHNFTPRLNQIRITPRQC
ncbi:Uncharacterized protein APZ42_011978 [Daphnia magna]|uniref:Uncharacterized protein n=1 Tax=Daphnia magna TaxID=35525 RepID=A0A162SC24_9CRUS|nr:Uncharacterized protein APZ42_011978 [Daphnia magna]